jgi:hypothetical protein
LEVGLITKGPEYRVLLVKEIEDSVEFRDFALVHDEDTVVIGWWS